MEIKKTEWKVLIVEDLSCFQVLWRRRLSGVATVLSATTIEDAKEMFGENPDIDVVVLDACVPGTTPTTFGLIKSFRETFHGPMIAISDRVNFRSEMIKLGCSHQSSGKEDVVEKVTEVLGSLVTL